MVSVRCMVSRAVYVVVCMCMVVVSRCVVLACVVVLVVLEWVCVEFAVSVVVAVERRCVAHEAQSRVRMMRRYRMVDVVFVNWFEIGLFRRGVYSAFALTGRVGILGLYPQGGCPGLCASAPTGRVGESVFFEFLSQVGRPALPALAPLRGWIVAGRRQ